jgi:hypothetical protein
MHRRRYLRTAAVVGAGLLAGCTDLVETRQLRGAPAVLADRPAAVYYPTHVDGMAMIGATDAGPYRVALMYSYPHRFWTVTGAESQQTEIGAEDDVHLMAVVWDRETETLLPESGLSVAIERDGTPISEEVIYPMLSQPMGFHYGANFGLDGEGSYNVSVRVGGVSTRRTGAYRGRFESPATGTIPFEYSATARDELPYTETMDRAGERAARRPMGMGMLPSSALPAPAALPGVNHGTTTIGDARLVVQSLSPPPAGLAGGRSYLAISARTPYNAFVLPAMAIEGRVTRAGEPVYAGELSRTLDPALNYHYGAVVPSVEPGDRLEIGVRVPSQVARHEGYETAFLSTETATVTLA